MADKYAKNHIDDICPYFSFSPREISSFIIPEAHTEHKINIKKIEEICISHGDMHKWRLETCDVLISRVIKNKRYWGDSVQHPCSKHYKNVKKIRDNKDLYDPDIIIELQNITGGDLEAFSKSLSKYMTKKLKPNQNQFSDFQKNKAKKKSIKRIKQIDQQIEDGILFNYGKPWSNKDTNLLTQSFDEGEGYSEIALKLGRQEKSVKRRLKRLGYILD